MEPNRDDVLKALAKLLKTIAGPAHAGSIENGDIAHQIDRSIERAKVDASEGAALIDACAPHGRAMLTQAQQRLEGLESLKLLEQVASEYFDSI
jgi:hypothetical protein